MKIMAENEALLRQKQERAQAYRDHGFLRGLRTLPVGPFERGYEYQIKWYPNYDEPDGSITVDVGRTHRESIVVV